MSDDQVHELRARIEQLEARVEQLEQGAQRGSTARRRPASSPAATVVDVPGLTVPYVPAELEVSETWIELHEQSARPQLQRLIRRVVEVEGPVTERLVLDRVRRAWGLRRAGGRVQEAFDQAVRQLVARGLVERLEDGLVEPGAGDERVRVPGDDEATRRAADDVPIVELVRALTLIAAAHGGIDEDELTMAAAKLFGWTRRGGSIQERLETALARGIERGLIAREDGRIRAVEEG